MGSKQAEVQILIYFCRKLRGSKITFQKTKVLLNLYLQQIKKTNAALATLHEDLQYDFKQQLAELII